jgi:PEGA domain
MLPRYLMLAAALAMAVPAFAQEEGERQAVPRGSRPQGDNPRTGTAVPRSPAPDPGPAPTPRAAAPAPADRGRADRGRSDNVYRGGAVIVNPPPVYYNYYSYPRWSYPYGYGAFGLGYFYYDPYRWYPGYYSGYSGYYGPGYYPRTGGFGFDIGELRLEVSPRHAQVFVDGYYTGTVDNYDGTFQALKLESGAYSIRIAAPGYEDLMFDVRITPGQKINYRGELRRLRP